MSDTAISREALDRLEEKIDLVIALLQRLEVNQCDMAAGDARITKDSLGRRRSVENSIADTILEERMYAQKMAGEHKDLFINPGLDIMLDLYNKKANVKRVSISSACISSGVPSTTALRWLSTLERRGLVERQVDAADRRRHFVYLSESGIDLVERILPRRSRSEE